MHTLSICSGGGRATPRSNGGVVGLGQQGRSLSRGGRCRENMRCVVVDKRALIMQNVYVCRPKARSDPAKWVAELER